MSSQGSASEVPDRSTILSAAIEVGVSAQPFRTVERLNLGQLTTDQIDRPLLNQVALTADRPISPGGQDLQLGYRLQVLFGADARFLRLTGQFPSAHLGLNAIAATEANVTLHVAKILPGGLDFKVGQYLSPLGFEAVLASGNPFYSHSYIFSYGVPAGHDGVLVIGHAARHVDLYAGVDAGANTSLVHDNNGAPAAILGFGVSDSKLTLLALTHVGPENPRGTPLVRPNRDLRYYNDIYASWRISPKLTAVTEANYVRDDGLHAAAGGVAQYLLYDVSKSLRSAVRFEVWRDDRGVFAAGFRGANDFLRLEEGRAVALVPAGRATYASATLGLTVKVPTPSPQVSALFRPEARYDRALSGSPFDGRRRTDQATLALDLVIFAGSR